ncbi:phage tail protein [Teredinibacter purpureus]|uniref:phage tail protein n=1 Tax=Teredinibacter purpureus TaxID=2731756 RepID=UPI000698C427|nr:tail fiber protein [Teredinibacter purpureus]
MPFKLPVGSIIPYAGIVTSTENANGNTVPPGFAPLDSKTYNLALARQGWLLCDGAVVSVAEFFELYKAIGFVYGKKDKGHFYLPDYRGQFLRGVNHDAENTLDPEMSHTLNDPNANDRKANSNPSAWSGNFVGSIQADALQEHVHPYVETTLGGIGGDVSPLYGQVNTEAQTGEAVAPTVDAAKPVRTATETRAKNTYVNYLIRAQTNQTT